MGAKPGNQNALKKGPTRLDVHISVADARRAALERYFQQKGQPYTEEDMVRKCRQVLYDWLDDLAIQFPAAPS